MWTCLLCIASWTIYSQQTSEADSSSSLREAKGGAAAQSRVHKESSSRSESPRDVAARDDIAIIYTHHARERMAQRGANDNEVRDTILTGEEVPAYGGKQKFEKTYDCDCHYKGKYYDDKKVEVVAKQKEDGWVIITVIADRK